MKLNRTFIVVSALTALFALTTGNVYAGKGKGARKSSSSYHSGHYKSGSGSAHKGGHYKNSSTGHHYRKRR